MRIFYQQEIFNNQEKFWRSLVRVALAILIIIIFAQKIELPTIDLGRHLENGRLIFKSPELLWENFYSYTEPEHKFINHHWLAGVIFYFVYFIGGFKLLTIFNILLALAIFFSFFKLAEKRANFYLVALLSIPIILLMGERTEIRPEMFSCLFFAITWLTLESQRLNRRQAFKILLPLFIIWVNIHIYFFLGLALVAFYLVADILSRLNWTEIFHQLKGKRIIKLDKFKWQLRSILKQSQKDIYAFIALVLTGLINPNHIKGLFYPVNIFRNFGYQVLENKSIFFLQEILLNYNYQIFKYLLFFLAFSLLANYIFQKKLRLSDCFLAFFLALLALLAVRNLTIFALVALVIISANLYPALKFLGKKGSNFLAEKFTDFNLKFRKQLKPFFPLALILLVLLVSGFLVVDRNSNQRYLKGEFGLGLTQESTAVFKFYSDNQLSGPIFNNYDVGSALIFGLAGKTAVFVDNRPEAYSVNFFKNIYLPMQTDEEVWQELNKQHGFKTIIFSHLDATPWAKTFLQRILLDENWSLVYFNHYYVVLVSNQNYSEDFLTEYGFEVWEFRQLLRSLAATSSINSKFNLASLASLRGQKDLAEEIYRQIIQEKVNNARAYFSLAYLYSVSTSPADLYQSIEYFRRGLEIEPNMPGIYSQMGMVYWNLTDYSQAEYYWRLARKKDRHDQTAKDYLKQLENLKKQDLLSR